MSRLLALFMLTIACRAAPAEVPAPTTPSEGRATAMPDSLRCRVAEDCAPEPNCYWSAPKCVAVASIVAAPKCGSDADPPDLAKTPVSCGCDAGQCVPRSSP